MSLSRRSFNALLNSFVASPSMAKQKQPEHLMFVGEMPRTASGKIQKHVLRESFDRR